MLVRTSAHIGKCFGWPVLNAAKLREYHFSPVETTQSIAAIATSEPGSANKTRLGADVRQAGDFQPNPFTLANAPISYLISPE